MTVFQVCSWVLIMTVGANQPCDVPPAYEKQIILFVFCHFDYDIGAMKKPITVLFYGTGDPDTPVTVAYIAFLEGKCEYTARSGFTIIGNVTDTLILRIDNVTQENAGRYECHVLPSMPGNYASCNFTLKDGDAPGTNTSIDKKDASYSRYISNDGKDIMLFVKPLIITTVSVMLLLIVIGGIIILTALYKRIMNKSDGRENGFAEPMLTNNGSQSEHNQP